MLASNVIEMRMERAEYKTAIMLIFITWLLNKHIMHAAERASVVAERRAFIRIKLRQEPSIRLHFLRSIADCFFSTHQEIIATPLNK